MNPFLSWKWVNKNHYPGKKRIVKKVIIGVILGIIVGITLNLIEKKYSLIELLIGATDNEITPVGVNGIVIVLLLAILLLSLKRKKGE